MQERVSELQDKLEASESREQRLQSELDGATSATVGLKAEVAEHTGRAELPDSAPGDDDDAGVAVLNAGSPIYQLRAANEELKGLRA